MQEWSTHPLCPNQAPLFLSPYAGPISSFQKWPATLEIGGHAQDGAGSATDLSTDAQPPTPAPSTQSSLQQEQYSSSMTRKQLSKRALGRTSFRLSPGALRRDNSASTLGPTFTP